MSEPTGLLIIDKPAGLSSFDVVRRVRRIGKTRKVGHTGTLDPDATGLLAICLGRCTKLAKFIVLDDKWYRFTLRFGAATTTDDSSGEVIREAKFEGITRAGLEAILPEYIGCIEQVPPVYSALRINGKRAYEMARAGEEVKMKARQIRVDDIQVIDFSLPEATLEVRCGPGTYVRSLARDFGERLGSAAHTTAIRRLAVGPFSLDQAVSLDELQEDNFVDHLLSPLEMVKSLKLYELGPEEVEKFKLGQPLSLSAGEVGTFGAAHYEQELIAIVEVRQKEDQLFLWPRRVMI